MASDPREDIFLTARLAQLVERTAFNRMVEGSSPSVGVTLLLHNLD